MFCSIICPEVEGDSMSTWTIMSKVRIEAFMWVCATCIDHYLLWSLFTVFIVYETVPHTHSLLLNCISIVTVDSAGSPQVYLRKIFLSCWTFPWCSAKALNAEAIILRSKLEIRNIRIFGIKMQMSLRQCTVKRATSFLTFFHRCRGKAKVKMSAV